MNPQVQINFDLPRISIDFETFPMGEGDHPTHPKPVVLSIYDENKNNLLIHARDPKFRSVCEYLLQPGIVLCLQNGAYDLVVMYYAFPDLITAIFDKYERGEVYDTMLAEKMLNLTSIGIIKEGFVRGKPVDFRYDLATLTSAYLGVDMTEDKKKATPEEMERSEKYSKMSNPPMEEWDACGAWRTRYHHLYDWTDVEKWPERARTYALNDSANTGQVAECQIAIGRHKYEKPFKTLAFQCMKAFMFALRTSVGVYTDPVKVEEVKKWVDSEMTLDKLKPLYEANIYHPEIPAGPYANNAKAHVEGCKRKKDCECPLKMKKAVPAGKSDTKMREYIISMVENGTLKKKDLRISDSGKSDIVFMEAYKEGENLVELLKSGREKDKKRKDVTYRAWQDYSAYLSFDKHFIKNIIEQNIQDPVIDNFLHYQKFSGLKSNEIPRMMNPVLYPQYDCLKKTGRSSSYGFKKGQELFPSCNIQQIDAQIREAYTAREGFYMLSTDYSSMELITAAQTCKNLLGYSVLMEKIKEGFDVHAYLGAQIALRKDEVFGKLLEWDPAYINKPDEVYKMFYKFKGTPFFKKYRTLAKPVGLGFWGGLGLKTFIVTARTIYGVIIESEEEAGELREIWYQVFPESGEYFKYMKKFNKDEDHSYVYEDAEGKDKKWQKYWYESPYGMLRRNCDYTQVMNGMALQTPGGEGATTSAYLITRECFDPSKESVLFGNYLPYGFIHDEELGDVRTGTEYEVAHRIDELMKYGFKFVCPDVPVKTEPALMTNWSKFAESFYNHEDKTLSLWVPKKQEKKGDKKVSDKITEEQLREVMG